MLNSALEFFEELYDYGIRFQAVDGALEATAPRGILTDDLRQEIATNKQQLLRVIGDATGVLNRYGVRRIGSAVGLWRAADLPEVRIALKAVGLGDAEVRYLDDPDANIPSEFRKSWPPLIQQIWEKNGVLGTPEERIAAESKARRINSIFDEYGTAPTPSGIKAETVLRGELERRKRKA